MFLRELVICVALMVSYSTQYRSHGSRCPSCQIMFLCPAARKLFNNKNEESNELLKAAYCGTGPENFAMVCCDELNSVTSEKGDSSLENHPNLNLLPDKCGLVEGERIVGGSSVGLYEFPWMALISKKTRLGPQFLCGGTVINERYVLTAAHCLEGIDVAGVRVGDHDYNKKRDCQGEVPFRVCETVVQDCRVEDIKIHEKYQAGVFNKHDIGLIRLKNPINFNHKNAGTICLPITSELRDSDVRGSHGIVAGWGLTEHTPTSELLKTTVPILNDEECRNLYGLDEDSDYICAGEYMRDTCDGDSGGPLMAKTKYNSVHRYVQFGIVSQGQTKCGTGVPSIYVDVTKHLKWILDNMRL